MNDLPHFDAYDLTDAEIIQTDDDTGPMRVAALATVSCIGIAALIVVGGVAYMVVK